MADQPASLRNVAIDIRGGNTRFYIISTRHEMPKDELYFINGTEFAVTQRIDRLMQWNYDLRVIFSGQVDIIRVSKYMVLLNIC